MQFLAAGIVKHGEAFLTAPNERDALTLAREARPAPSLILLDLAMPVMTGW